MRQLRKIGQLKSKSPTESRLTASDDGGNTVGEVLVILVAHCIGLPLLIKALKKINGVGSHIGFERYYILLLKPNVTDLT